jgi:hypothetical protein
VKASLGPAFFLWTKLSADCQDSEPKSREHESDSDDDGEQRPLWGQTLMTCVARQSGETLIRGRLRPLFGP